MIRPVLATLLTAALLTACTPADPRAGESRPVAGKAGDSAETAFRLARVQAAAVAGDEDGVRREMDAMHKDLMRSMKLPDAGRPIDREAARTAAKRVPGVHSAVWIDRANFLALVDRNDQRSMATIDAICDQLAPLGDTLAVVVHVQSRAARTGDDLETINRNCQLAEGDRAMFQRDRQLDVIPTDARTQHRAQQPLGGDATTTRRRADEAARLLEASTPEM